jgi:hypothetical protein
VLPALFFDVKAFAGRLKIGLLFVEYVAMVTPMTQVVEVWDGAKKKTEIFHREEQPCFDLTVIFISDKQKQIQIKSINGPKLVFFLKLSLLAT